MDPGFGKKQQQPSKQFIFMHLIREYCLKVSKSKIKY